jgi:predicted DNA-binding protein
MPDATPSDWVSLGGKVPPQLHQRVKVYAAKTGKQVRDILREAVEQYLERNESDS